MLCCTVKEKVHSLCFDRKNLPEITKWRTSLRKENVVFQVGTLSSRKQMLLGAESPLKNCG